MRFYGNEICCGSYACLNAMGGGGADLPLFEISTAAPFGVKHCENAKFDRLLTTFSNPNEGLNDALALWGYRVFLERYSSGPEAVSALKTLLQCREKVLLGPIDMGGLAYQPVPEVLRSMDHYVMLEYASAQETLCTDSEGFYRCAVSYAQLEDWISVEEIPEAEGKIHLRTLEKERAFDRGEILASSLAKASRRLTSAEEQGQGSNAIEACGRFLEQAELCRWKLSFLYDLEYLKQRKGLFRWFLSALKQAGVIDADRGKAPERLLFAQEELLGAIYMRLRWENQFDRERLRKIAELEKALADEIFEIGRI